MYLTFFPQRNNPLDYQTTCTTNSMSHHHLLPSYVPNLLSSSERRKKKERKKKDTIITAPLRTRNRHLITLHQLIILLERECYRRPLALPARLTVDREENIRVEKESRPRRRQKEWWRVHPTNRIESVKY